MFNFKEHLQSKKIILELDDIPTKNSLLVICFCKLELKLDVPQSSKFKETKESKDYKRLLFVR